MEPGVEPIMDFYLFGSYYLADSNGIYDMNTKLYKGKYRIASTRLKNWDYGSNAAYFVTICTQNRVWAFGTIRNAVMYPNNLGHAVLECWHAIPSHFRLSSSMPLLSCQTMFTALLLLISKQS